MVDWRAKSALYRSSHWTQSDCVANSGLVFEHINACTQLAHERMMQCIQLEREEPTTLNEDTLSELKDKFLTHFRAMHRTHNEDTNNNLQSFIRGGYGHSSYCNNAVSI